MYTYCSILPSNIYNIDNKRGILGIAVGNKIIQIGRERKVCFHYDVIHKCH